MGSKHWRKPSKRKPTVTQLDLKENIMKALVKATAIAAFALCAAAAYAGDSVEVTVEGLTQDQGGSNNHQFLDLGVSDTGILSKANVTVNASNIRQLQSGANNKQTMKIGYVDKDVKSHTLTVTANNVTQSQTGNDGEQKLRIGVIE
jgi:hypothetical protein